ncbi:cytochrome P450 [Nocardioides sp. C4-1]|uniref:cytochrome P450 n=1 Tax=Nocardioides sp. C4-1 TaxID=3151851 RepID=UPI0032679EED
MTALDDVPLLTAQRFRATSSVGGSTPVPPRGAVLPPGPRWPALAQTVALMRFRHWFHPYLHRRYGDVFTVRLVPGARPLVMLTRPEHTKEVFAGDPEVFHAGKANSILGPVMGRHSLLLQDSTEHQRARKLLMPAFNGQALKGYADLVADLARDEVAYWPDDARFRSLDRMNVLTLEVILRVVFGVTDERRLALMRPRVNATVDIEPVVLLGWTYPRLQKVGVWRRAVDNQYELDRLIHAEIRERRVAPDLAERTDVLSRLIRVGHEPGADPADRLSDVELRDQLVTLLLAGHETTATALAWSLHELGRHPELHARTVDAVREGDDAWLEAVLKEAMRLHPVIPMVVRTLLEPTTVAGHDLPAGTTVGPSIVVTHQRDDLHPDPEVFRPERFLGQNPPANTWIPFGGGVRRCIGAGFSVMEGVAVLREVFRSFDVEAVGDDVPKVRNITSVPRGGAVVRAVRRPRPEG